MPAQSEQDVTHGRDADNNQNHADDGAADFRRQHAAVFAQASAAPGLLQGLEALTRLR